MVRKGLLWTNCTVKQARDVCQRNQVSGRLFTQAKYRLLDPEWHYGPTVYVIDTLTNKAARITIQGPDEFDVKISSRTGEAVFDDLNEREAAYGPDFRIIDNLVVID